MNSLCAAGEHIKAQKTKRERDGGREKKNVFYDIYSVISLFLPVETQRRIEYTRQKVMRIEQMNEQLRKLSKSNKGREEKLDRLLKRFSMV